MSKKERKATFQDLIAKKTQKEKDQFRVKEIYVTSMDRTLTFKKLKDDLLLDVISEIKDEGSVKEIASAYKKLIYLCCDILQDTELHKELEVIDPFDTVEKLFDITEIMEIGDQLSDFVNARGKVEEIKN